MWGDTHRPAEVYSAGFVFGVRPLAHARTISAMLRVSRTAWAKVNLALSVGAPLPPGSTSAGFHPIASWMSCIDLCDDVTVEPRTSGGAVLERSWAANAPRASPIDWPPDRDLAMRALAALELELGRPLHAVISVVKRIPVGGGLGGGSSDAAAVLLALNDAFRLALPVARLRALGATLGSDVPFFIDEADPPRPAVVSGLGAEIARTERVTSELRVLVPPFGCPTGPVYREFDSQAELAREPRTADVLKLAERARVDRADLFNDLQAAACRVEPRLASITDLIRRATGEAPLLTGSGSSLILFRTGADLDEIAGCRVIRTRLV